MRILLVSGFFESHGGGIEIVAGAMGRALARRGHACAWAAAGFDPAPDDGLVEAVPLPAWDPLEQWAGLPMPLPARSACVELERQVHAADAVIIHDALYASSQLAARYARRYEKPWLLVQHIGAIPYSSLVLRTAMRAANGSVTRPLIRQAPQTVFISDLVRRFFAEDLPAGRGPLLFNGVDHRVFSPPSERPTRVDGRRRLLFVGRFVEKKGLAALRELAASRPEWDLLMAGSGPLDPTRWHLPNVHVLGRKSREELAQLYRETDALVLPSVGEGFPLVIQEAMASGLAVFCGLDSAGADPGAKALLHGVAVDTANPAATAARFAEAIAATPPGVDCAVAAHARETYDWDRNAAWLERNLLDLMAPET